MKKYIDRRNFIRSSALAGSGLLLPFCLKGSNFVNTTALMGNRFLTLCIPIRVTPWEVSRDVKLIDEDESGIHTPEIVRSMSDAFRKYCPEARLTWGFTLNALEDTRSNYAEIRKFVVECHEKYGDEVAYFPAYFPVMYLPRTRINREMSEAINIISNMVGGGYRAQSVMGGYLSAENMRYLAEEENIHVAHGVIWSQYGIDAGDADGSPSYPYYPSREHICKPAQGKEDFIDCVNLDGWTMDFVTARKPGVIWEGPDAHNSRFGMGPIETYGTHGLDLGHKQYMHTQTVHFDRGFELNKFAWVTSIWEVALVGQYSSAKYEPDLIIRAIERWIKDTKRRWPDSKIISFGEFGKIWRQHYKNNDEWNYRFEAQGSGIAGSKAEIEIRWFMNKSFRLGLIRNRKENTPELVMDFTRYDFPTHELPDSSPEVPQRNWSLMNRINQKGLRSQDQPVPISRLMKDDKDLINKYYPELFKT